MNLLQELQFLLSVNIHMPVVQYRVFEEGISIIAIAKDPSMFLRRKHNLYQILSFYILYNLW